MQKILNGLIYFICYSLLVNFLTLGSASEMVTDGLDMELNETEAIQSELLHQSREHQKLVLEKYSRIKTLQLHLSNKIELLQTEKLDALVSHKKQTRKVEELQQQENNLRRTIGKLQHDIGLKTDEVKRSDNSINHLTTQNGKLGDEIASLKAQLASARNDLEKLQKQIESNYGPPGQCRLQGEGCLANNCASMFSCCCRGLHCAASPGAPYGFCREK